MSMERSICEILEGAHDDNPKLSSATLTACLVNALGKHMLENLKMTPAPSPGPSGSVIRVYVDGCFDILHSGHYNALRQARTLGNVLVAGVHSDAEIQLQKGMPVMNNDERLEAVRACKWVDEVVFDTPYQPSVALLDSLNCDFVVHGDDMPVSADGTSAYDEVRCAGRLRIIKRTEGVSTTDLIGRLLTMTREHHLRRPSLEAEAVLDSNPRFMGRTLPLNSSFLATTRRISQFSNNRSPNLNDKVVYIGGSFDLFHVGHIETLKQAKALGTFLLVGLHDDTTVNEMYGANFPIMNMHERALNVLSARVVDEVVLGAPFAITESFIKALRINVVASGGNVCPKKSNADQFVVPSELGIHRILEAKHSLTTADIIKRIVENRNKLQEKFTKRAPMEDKYKSEQVHDVLEI